jgi:endonuclease-3
MDKKDVALESCIRLEKMYPSIRCSLVYTHSYELLFAVILSAQCTDARVNIVTKELFKKYTSLEDFANCEISELERDIKPCGFFRNKAKNIRATANILLKDFNGELPNNMKDLLKLAGVGRKTANLIMGDVYHQPAIVTDTHCIRITGRLGLTSSKDPSKVEKDLVQLIPPEKSSDYCHRLVQFGRDICKARTPVCYACPLNDICMSSNLK